MVIPKACTVGLLNVHANTATAVTCIVTIRKNGADAGTPSTLSATLSGGSGGPLTATDLTDSISFVAGDTISISINVTAGALTVLTISAIAQF